MEIEQPTTLDILDTSGTPALSSTTDMPVVETKPDAQNEVVEAATEEVKTEAESATVPEEPPASDEPKKAKGVQKRLDELTRQREDERRRAEAAEARLDRALAALERKPEVSIEESDPEPVRPTRGQDTEAYEQAIMDYAEQKATWIARQEVRAAQAELAQQEQVKAAEHAQQEARESYQSRVNAFKEKHADFEQVAESPDVQVSMPMAAAILHSENGPNLQYYLGQNPNEAERIRQLSPPLQLLELGKIEAKLTAPPPPKPAVSAASAPIKPLSGAAPSSQKSPEDMSMDEYAAYRKSQLRPGQSVRH